MRVSVIIPTFKRPVQLLNLLEILNKQSFVPDEIIVVDSASEHRIEQIVMEFKSKSCQCEYIYIPNPKDSISVARNMGALKAKSDILVFLDDDDIPETTYVEEIIKCFYEHPDALVVQGNAIKEESINFKRRIWREFWTFYAEIFFLFRLTTCEKNILPSGKTTFAINCNNNINCQWASGGLTAVKKEIFNNFKFDDKLIKYCYTEDADFSYRIYKQYPNAIVLASKARINIFPSLNSESPLKKSVVMEKTYSLYFVSKNLGEPQNFALFMWSEIGMFLKELAYCFVFFNSLGKFFVYRLVYSLYAYYVCIKCFNKIRKLDIEYINRRYLL